MLPRKSIYIGGVLLVVIGCYLALTRFHLSRYNHAVGDTVDELNGVKVYFNGGVNNTSGRNTSPDGYNMGLRYQCVEFVKRYYYEKLGHKMPDSYGHAKSFFDLSLADGALNTKRNLLQYANGSETRPEAEDIFVFSARGFNPYGHVAIVSQVTEHSVEIVQQNPGPLGASRDTIPMRQENGKWLVGKDHLLGWLRLSTRK